MISTCSMMGNSTLYQKIHVKPYLFKIFEENYPFIQCDLLSSNVCCVMSEDKNIRFPHVTIEM
jgi:hypothetical protein